MKEASNSISYVSQSESQGSTLGYQGYKYQTILLNIVLCKKDADLESHFLKLITIQGKDRSDSTIGFYLKLNRSTSACINYKVV